MEDFVFEVPKLGNRDGELFIRLHEGKPEWQLSSDTSCFLGWEPCPQPIFDAIVAEYQHLINPPPPPEPEPVECFFTFITERRFNLPDHEIVFRHFDGILQIGVVRAVTNKPGDVMREIRFLISQQVSSIIFGEYRRGYVPVPYESLTVLNEWVKENANG